ncbi:unnamed protein product [Didymodactylos carnosus]|uniref:Uncharacterized protein n=1 Tax=Didymodactylos carnosus TaxID=1234261 RepID=A0A8S2E1I5_9BILA|nr:unnamed protein product [Didymodactylos carnosus]CAF3822265.1 unnamed protein product [Didymodactylos carnosus]
MVIAGACANIEVLRFTGAPSLANHVGVWQKCIADSKWLPNLKSIEFRLDVVQDDQIKEIEVEKQANEQFKQFLKELALQRSTVSIMNYEEKAAAMTEN